MVRWLHLTSFASDPHPAPRGQEPVRRRTVLDPAPRHKRLEGVRVDVWHWIFTSMSVIRSYRSSLSSSIRRLLNIERRCRS
jgi:hypothetical protein